MYELVKLHFFLWNKKNNTILKNVIQMRTLLMKELMYNKCPLFIVNCEHTFFCLKSKKESVLLL